jgi:hypothetical protein
VESHRQQTARAGHHARRLRTLRVKTPGELAGVVELIRGGACDLRSVALDHEGGNLHVPLVRSATRASPVDEPVAHELIVRRVVEFSVENAAGTRWFELDGVTYDPHSRQLTIRSTRGLQFLLTVDRLDLACITGGKPRRLRTPEPAAAAPGPVFPCDS